MTLAIEERTIMRKRKCKHCSSEIYLQYIPVTSSIKWVSFDSADEKLHSCPNRPLNFRTKTLIQKAVDGMNYNNTTQISKGSKGDTGAKVNGAQHVFFGSCSGSMPPIEPGGTGWELLICDVPAGAEVGDRVVASAAVRGLPSPVLVLSEIFHTQPESLPLDDYLIFAFVNGAESFSTPPQEVTVSYIIFRES